jgi:excisionase family DNA binding protein
MLSRPLLTVHEVAELLKLKESTVRSLIGARKLRAIKFGREWRVAARDLETFLNENATTSPSPSVTPSAPGRAP